MLKNIARNHTHVELVTVIDILLELVPSYYTCRASCRACICWSLVTARKPWLRVELVDLVKYCIC